MSSAVVVDPKGTLATEAHQRFGSVVMEFEAAGTIPRRSVVLLNTSLKVAKAATGTAAAGTTLGIALEAATAGRVVQVVVFGPVDQVPADGAIAAGSPVIASTTTAGSVIAKAAPTTGEGLGWAPVAASGGYVTVWVNRSIGGIT